MQMTRMHPVAGPTITCGVGFTLRDLVVVVREFQVDATRMEVEMGAERVT